MSDASMPPSLALGRWGETHSVLRSTLVVGMVLSIAFPYVQIVPLGSYTQPYALLLSGLVVLLTRFAGLRQMRWTDAANLVCFAVIGIALFAITCFPYRDMQEYKYLLTYISPLFITAACVTLLGWDRDLFAKMVAGSIVVWFWVAMTQALIDPRFMTGLLGVWGEAAVDIAASGRGVVGLAPEPTHHAFHMLLLGGCIALLGRHRWALILCIVDVVFLARSASGILVLGLAGAAAMVIYAPRTAIMLGLAAAILFAINIGDIVLQAADGNRMLTLLGIALSDPLALFLSDYSTNIRIGGSLVGTWEATLDLLYPHGLSFTDWSEARLLILERYPFLLDLSQVGIPSGYGVLLYQAGILALPFIVLSTRRLILAASDRVSIVAVLFTPLVFVFQYYLSAPQFSLVYASAIFVYMNRTKHEL